MERALRATPRKASAPAGSLAGAGVFALLLFQGACSPEPESVELAGASGDQAVAAEHGRGLAPRGCEVLEWEPNAGVVPSAILREQIAASGWPWRVQHVSSGIELLLVPRHTGLRGSTAEDPSAASDEQPAHAVRVEQSYYLGRYEVTQAQWSRVMGSNPSFFQQAPDLPVEQVDRTQVQAFLTAAGLELPTEAQWEVACRAGTDASDPPPLETSAWTRATSKGRSQRVGQKAPNALGFADMLGNVWEWTADAYREDAYRRLGDGVSASHRERIGTSIVLRGGSWYDSPRRARPAARSFGTLDHRASHVGLRVLLLPKAGSRR